MQKKMKFQNSKKRATVGKKEKRRLLQLVLCMSLFLIVFFGKGNLPEGVLQYIQTNADFKGAFTELGKAVSDGEPILQVFGETMIKVFGENEETEPESPPIVLNTSDETVQAALSDLNVVPDRDVILSRLGIIAQSDEIELESEQDSMEEYEPLQSSDVQGVPNVYTGPALPKGATMEYSQLGLSEVAVPVMGEITSVYGYRNHPVDGEYSFHSGIDIAANKGTPVLAFSAGTVDYIGESEAYGLYTQLNHGNGITTFYCHCSQLYVQKGETVSAGQTIAAVGDTGNATGPHLHLELKKDGVLLNPAYYLELSE